MMTSKIVIFSAGICLHITGSFRNGFVSKMKDHSKSLRILSTVKDRKGSSPQKEAFPPEPLFCCPPPSLPKGAVAVHWEEGSGQARANPQTVTFPKDQPELVDVVQCIITCSTETTKAVLSSTGNLLVQREVAIPLVQLVLFSLDHFSATRVPRSLTICHCLLS